MKSKVRYSVYNPKDDMPIIISGTIEECAKALGIKRASFDAEASRQRHGIRYKGSKLRKRIIVRDEIDDGEEEDGD